MLLHDFRLLLNDIALWEWSMGSTGAFLSRAGSATFVRMRGREWLFVLACSRRSSSYHDTEASVTALGKATSLIDGQGQFAHLVVFISQARLSIVRVVAARVVFILGWNVSIIELLKFILFLRWAWRLLLLDEALLLLESITHSNSVLLEQGAAGWLGLGWRALLTLNEVAIQWSVPLLLLIAFELIQGRSTLIWLTTLHFLVLSTAAATILMFQALWRLTTKVIQVLLHRWLLR